MENGDSFSLAGFDDVLVTIYRDAEGARRWKLAGSSQKRRNAVDRAMNWFLNGQNDVHIDTLGVHVHHGDYADGT